MRITISLLVIGLAAVVLAFIYSGDNRPANAIAKPAVAIPGAVDAPTKARVQSQRVGPLPLAEREVVEAESQEPEEIPEPIVAAPANSDISGFVLNDLELPVAGIQVDLYKDRIKLSSTKSVENGGFHFGELSAGNYSVRLDQNSLPEEYLGPWMQDIASPGTGNDYQAKQVEIPEEGGSFEVELRVFAKSIAWGRVIGPNGEPAEAVMVRLQAAASKGQPASLNATATTDEQGRFELQDVYPGHYVIQAFPQNATLEHLRVEPAPIPRAIEVLAGGMSDLGTLQLGAGRGSVVGRVIDETGAPFHNLSVIAYPAGSPGEGFAEFGFNNLLASAKTDAKGFYQLTKLPAASIKIQVNADYMEQPLGEAQTAFWVPPVVLQLSGSGERKAPDIVLPRSRPFRIFGKVTLDETWATESRAAFDDVRIEITLLDPDATPIPNRPSFFQSAKHRIDADTGEFELLLETPHNPVKITFTCKRGETDEIEEIVYDLVPDSQTELAPRFPHSAE